MFVRALLLFTTAMSVGCVSGRAGTRDPDGGLVRFDAGVRRDAGSPSLDAGPGRDGGGGGNDASAFFEIICDDGIDQDGDGMTDCADDNCANAPCDAAGSFCVDMICGGCRGAATETACGDGADEDCDGVTDCADPDCDAMVCGPGDVVCAAGACPCASGFAERICGDGTDDDCDTLYDCDDPDCERLVCGSGSMVCLDGSCSCSGSVEFCNDGDEDCNGVIDNGCPRGLGTCCPAVGGTFGAALDGTEFADRCPLGTMLIGIAGRESTRIDQIQRICAALIVEVDREGRPDFGYPVRRGSQIVGTPQGGTGGTAFMDLCPGNEIVIGVRGAGDDTGVTSVSLQCGAVTIARDALTWRVTVTPTTSTPERGGASGTLGGNCAGGSVVTEVNGRAGASVGRLGFTCERLELQRI